MLKIWLAGFPVPPSINAQSAVVNGRMIKTREARIYDAQVALFIQKNKTRLKQITELLKPQIEDGKLALNVDCFIAFHSERVFTRSAKAESWAKTIDANNRLKSCLDGLVRALDVDDKYFFAGNCEKITCASEYDEQVVFCIQLFEPRRLSDIIQLIAEDSGEGKAH